MTCKQTKWPPPPKLCGSIFSLSPAAPEGQLLFKCKSDSVIGKDPMMFRIWFFCFFCRCSECFKRPSNSPAEVFTFICGVNNKYPWLHFAIPCPIWAKLHSLPFPRISPNTTRLRLVVFGLILGNGNSCNFAKYPTLYIKNSPRLRLVEFLTYLVGYFKNTPRTNFKSPKYPSAAPRGIWEIWNWSSGYFFQIVPELHFARDISNKTPCGKYVSRGKKSKIKKEYIPL